MICLESWYYQTVLLLAGLLLNPKLALDSFSICLLIVGCIMMISIGFNAAVSVRVSNELGAGHDKSAAFLVAVVNLVSFILCLIAAIVVLALRNVISYAFTDGETVAELYQNFVHFLPSPSSSMESNPSCLELLWGVDGKLSLHM